jgi:hypothetical protein
LIPHDPSLDEPVDHTDTGGTKGGDDNFYDGTGLPICGAFREDNDPNRRKGRVVKISDNGRIAVVETERGEATILVRITRQPSNSFKIGASCLKRDIDNMVLASDGIRLQVEGRIVPEGNEPISRVRASGLLTVWRRLFVEIDSMGVVDEGERQQHDDDRLSGDIPDPDATAFEEAFRQCYIRVILASEYNQPDTPWHHHFDDRVKEADYAQQYRNSLPEANDLWFVYIIGMYDPPEEYPTDDNDPESDANNYPSLLGRTQPEEPEYSFCYMEVVRDVAKEWGWYQDENGWMTETVRHVLRVITLHEIGHHFGHMPHNFYVDSEDKPISVMCAPRLNQGIAEYYRVGTGETVLLEAGERILAVTPLKFAADEIRRIRQTHRP